MRDARRPADNIGSDVILSPVIYLEPQKNENYYKFKLL